jgi:hypothetical protein
MFYEVTFSKFGVKYEHMDLDPDPHSECGAGSSDSFFGTESKAWLNCKKKRKNSFLVNTAKIQLVMKTYRRLWCKTCSPSL